MNALIATRPRRIVLSVGVIVVFAIIGLFASAALRVGAGPAAGVPAGNPFARGYDPAALAAFGRHPLGRYDTVVARPVHRVVTLYRRPAGRPYRRLGPLGHSYGSPLVFLVEARRRGWVRVQLPVRPNHSSAWIRASAVHLAVTDYRVTVNLPRRRLTVWRSARRIVRAPIGVGRAVSPTPAGRYYLAYLLRPPQPGGVFGAYAFGLSAYSDVYTSFAGGDGEIGLHGTDEPSGLGHYVSHGCIRVSNGTITRLAHTLPLGTPITIEH
jgi:lipoprotein-anchoring transpeptidase ErfK/SrfK